MKTFLSILIIGFGILFSDSFSYSKSKNLHGGRCTGSANCTACSSCSRCGHCNSGGTCGVCSGAYSKKSFYSTPRKKRKTTRLSSSTSLYSSTKKMKTDLAPSTTVKYYDTNNETIVKTIKEDTNIRELQSAKSKIIEKVEKNASLILLQNSGKWLKVRVKKSGKIGYVYYKNLY